MEHLKVVKGGARMKSAYCIAITACLTVIWLYEEKKKRGMAGNLCWKASGRVSDYALCILCHF